jgi:ABC-type bacteriocin/lantibiotic exporter with double-glycine peptidase domain
MNKVELKHIKIRYSDSSEAIIDFPEIVFNQGVNFIIGKNGCGKSTLLKGFTKHEDVLVEGQILFNGVQISNNIIGIVNQNPQNSITGELTFIQNLIQSKSSFWDLLSLSTLESKKEINKAKEFIETFNFPFEIEKLYYKESEKLSSGQQQLLAILMRVYRNGKILLLDECTANLDDINTKLVIETINRIANAGVVVLFVTHQWELLELKNSITYIIKNKKIQLNHGQENQNEKCNKNCE